MTPSRIVAPVGSEVVVLAGICGGDGYYVLNQPLEWILSNDSVGQFIEVGGMEHSAFNRLVPPSAKKFDGQYAWGRTGLKNRLITRGTPTPTDDIQMLKGQAFVSVSSESQGSTYVTCVAPKAEGWDKRRRSTIIHWVDAMWAVPMPSSASAGSVHPLTTVITRNTDGGGVEGWKVRYTIVGGAPAEFAPTGSNTVEVETGKDGNATAQLRQLEGRFDPGTTQIRVDVVRPKLFGEPELVVESGVTSVTWSAPALTIRAIGPKSAGINEAFNYRVEVSNPGDQVTRGVVLRTKSLPDGLEFISSTPKPTVYGNQYEWQLGDIAAGQNPIVVEVQLQSKIRGNTQLCFEVTSQSDQLQTEACAQTEIAVPCIGLEVEGPSEAKQGDQVTYNITVTNQCDEALEDVELVVQYEDGLDATGFPSPIRATMGTIEPGEEKSIPAIFDVLKSGEHCFKLDVSATGGHTARAQRCVTVETLDRANATLQLNGRRRLDQGQPLKLEGIVTNTGNSVLRQVTVTNRFSPSLEPTEVSRSFPHRWLPGGDELIFDLGELSPGESKPLRIQYDTRQIDASAFSEMTVSSPDIAPMTRRFEVQIEPQGTVGDQPDDSGFGGPSEDPPLIPDDGDITQPAPDERVPGSGSGSETRGQGTDSNDGSGIAIPPGESPIEIPDENRSGGDLVVSVKTLDPQIAVNGRGRIQFSIQNSSNVEDRDIDISILLPPSIRLTTVDDSANRLPVVNSKPDGTRFELQRRRSLRRGEAMTFIAEVIGIQPGQATFEVQAASNNSMGSVTATDSVFVTQ